MQSNVKTTGRLPRRGSTMISAMLVIFLCALMITGCLYKGVRVTGLEPQAKIIEHKNYRVLGFSDGQSSSFNLLWFIPVTPRVDYDRAAREAIDSLRGDNLIDVRTWMERQVWFLGMVEILHVRGKVIQYEK
jgi:hypothetical protein